MDSETLNTRSPHDDARIYFDLKKNMSFPDKRYLPRWQVANPIDYHLDNEPQPRQALSHDLSSVGICLETEAPLPVNSKVKLKVYLNDKVVFPVEGLVMWTHQADQKYMSGVVFEGITPHDQEMILQFAFEVNREDLVKHWFQGWNG